MGCGASSIPADSNQQPTHLNNNHNKQQQQPVQQNYNSHPTQQQQQPVQQSYNSYPPQQQQQQPIQQSYPPQQQQPRQIPTAPPEPPEQPQYNPPPPERTAGPPPPQPTESAEIDAPLPNIIPLPSDNEKTSNNEPRKEITAELLNEFVELEKEIRSLEANRSEEKLLLHQIEYKNVDSACISLREEISRLKQNTLKEYQDVAQFDLVAYMIKNNIDVISKNPQQTLDRQQEEYQYFEAKNKEDIADKQLKSLELQLNQIGHNIENCRREVDAITTLRNKVDGLLENIFNGEYGSDLEDRLELEAEQLLQYKKHLSLAHYKWWNGRQLLHHACSQIAYAVRRWAQIREVATDDGQAKYHMITDTRNNMIACHQNLERSAGYLNIKLPYWSEADDKNIVSSVNVIYNDVQTQNSYQKALQWYQYYHWRLALLLNWMDQVINNKIVADHHRVSRDFRNKYKELRIERLRCIKEKVKEVLGIDLDIEQFSKTEEEDDNDDDELPKVESDIAINAESFVAEGTQADMPDPNEAENDPSLVESVIKDKGSFRAIAMGTSTDTQTTESGSHAAGVGTDTIQTAEFGTDSNNIQTTETGMGTDPMPVTSTGEMSVGTDTQTEPSDVQGSPPAMRLIPLSDLAPPPSDDLLFGNVEQLQQMHQKQIEEFERVQESNKTRQEHGLKEKLRHRQSKRRKQKLQEEQESALTSPRKAENK